MNARKLIASLTLFAAAGLAHAADDTPAAAPAATSSTSTSERADKAAATAGALLLARAPRLNDADADVGAVAARAGAAPSSAGRSRAEVCAEAVEALKQHRSTLAEDLRLSNN